MRNSRNWTVSLALALVLSGAASLAAQPAKATSSEARKLYALEDGWTVALVQRDAAFFKRMLGPEYVYTDEGGVIGSAELIKSAIGGSDTVTAAHNENMKAVIHGNVAIVTGILVTKGRGAKGAFAHRYRYTDTFLKRGKSWVCIASEDFDIAK